MSSVYTLISKRAVLLLLLASTIVFVISNTLLQGYIFNKGSMAAELISPVDSMYEWNAADHPPFSYRILFKELILLITDLVFGAGSNYGFYLVYVAISWLSIMATSVSIYFLYRELRFNPVRSFFGGLAFLFLPAILMAYTVPVHTKEDMLGYFLLTTGIIFSLRKKWLPVLVLSVLGVLCRENLLIIPLVFLFSGYKGYLKYLPLVLGFITFVLIRVVVPETKDYNPFLGLMWNLNNPDQVIGFLFLSFGFIWPAVLKVLLQYKRYYISDALFRSAPAAVPLIFIASFTGGILNEIRLLYLAFPWFIYAFLLTFSYESFKSFYATWKGVLIFLAEFLILGCLNIFFVYNYQEYIPESRYNIPFEKWITITFFQLLLTLCFLPGIFLPKKKKHYGQDSGISEKPADKKAMSI